MRTKAVRISLHILVWLALYLLPYFAAYGNIDLHLILQEKGSMIHAVSTALLIVYAYLNQCWLVPFVYLQRRYVVYAGSVLACLLIVICLPLVLKDFESHDHQPGLQQGREFRHRGGGPPPKGVSKPSYNMILFVVCTLGSISISQQRQLLVTQKEKLHAELSFLKAQINPHFLFNTLNSIYALSIRKSDDAPKAIIQLSELMRYILKDSDADTVPLDKELHYISNYIALQKQRLGNTVRIQYVAPSETVNRRIAPLILMSFVENAFKHGVNPSQDSAIDISIRLQDEQLYLSVFNNKVRSVNQEEMMGIGLKNASSRLQHLYPGKHKLTVMDEEKTFSVNLIINLHV